MAHELRTIISRTRSKVKVTKVRNVKIPIFSLVSEKVAQGQGHEGQGHKGHRSSSQGLGESCLGSFVPPVTRGRCHTRAFLWTCVLDMPVFCPQQEWSCHRSSWWWYSKIKSNTQIRIAPSVDKGICIGSGQCLPVLRMIMNDCIR